MNEEGRQVCGGLGVGMGHAGQRIPHDIALRTTATTVRPPWELFTRDLTKAMALFHTAVAVHFATPHARAAGVTSRPADDQGDGGFMP